jgi:hypothetical protein
VIAVQQTRYPGRDGLTPLDGGGAKIVWHTTEGGNADAALMERCANHDLPTFQRLLDGTLNYYRSSGYVPHFTVCAQLRVVYQHLPLDVGGYALVDVAGGIRPNRAGSRVIQFEQIGHAAQIDAEMSDDDWRWMGDWLRQLCAESGVPFSFITPWVTYPASYGLSAGQRMTGAQFAAYSGICGHQHVAENEHGDPGEINLALLTEQPLPPPALEDDEMALYVTNSETRVFGGRDFPPLAIIYAIDGTGHMRNVRPAEWAAAKARGLAATPVPNAELDYQAA